MRVLPNSIPIHTEGLYQKLPALCETAFYNSTECMCLLFYIYFTFSDGTFGICAQFSLMTFPLFPEFQLYKWVIAVSNKDPEYVYFHMLLLFPK